MPQAHGVLLLLVAVALQQVLHASDRDLDNKQRLDLDGHVSPLEHEMDKEDVTLQPLNSHSSDSSLPTTFFIVLTIGFMLFSGLVFLLVLRQTSRHDTSQSECDSMEPPGNSRFCMKRTTFAVSDVGHSRLDDTHSSGSVVAVLGGNTSKCSILEVPQEQLKPSWDEISAAGLSTRQSRPPLINAPNRGREFIDSQAPSDNSSQTEDYSIDVLESPASTEYTLSSERDDVFLSTCWDVDSYQSTDCMFLSTTSSNVFCSNRGRNSGVWKQVYRPDDTTPTSSGPSPLTSGVLLVGHTASMRLDTRACGARANNQMYLDVEV